MSGTGITWPELYNFLIAHGCIEVSWHPGNHVTLRTPTGTEIGTCRPEKPGYVSPKHLATVGRAFNKNITDMQIWMGRKPGGKSKLTGKRAERTVRTERQREPVPHVDEIANGIQTTATRVYRSGPCRTVDYNARHQLLQIQRRLDAWYADNGGAA